MAFEINFQSQIKDPKQKRLLAVVLVLLLGGAGYVAYRTFFASPAGSGTPPTAPNGAVSPLLATPAARQASSTASGRKGDIERVQLDVDALKIPIFEKLTTYSKNLPLTIPTERNKNPFEKNSSPTPF